MPELPTDVVAVGLGLRDEDGSIFQRVWLVPVYVADQLAEQLGPPHFEQLASGEGSAALVQAYQNSGTVTVNHLE